MVDATSNSNEKHFLTFLPERVAQNDNAIELRENVPFCLHRISQNGVVPQNQDSNHSQFDTEKAGGHFDGFSIDRGNRDKLSIRLRRAHRLS